MKTMFGYATAFNQNLSGWCVSLIKTEPSHFDTGASSWVLARPVMGDVSLASPKALLDHPWLEQALLGEVR